MTPTRRLLVWLSLLAAAACGDALGPADLAGTYVLAAPVPLSSVVEFQRLAADTLILRADGTASRRGLIERSLTGAWPGVGIPYESDYTYTLEDDALGLQWQCPPGVFCFAAAEREWYDLIGGTFAIRARDGSGATYRRVSASAP